MKTLKNTLLLIASVITLTTSATVPVGYYNSIDGKRGQELKTAVHQLLKNHTVMT